MLSPRRHPEAQAKEVLARVPQIPRRLRPRWWRDTLMPLLAGLDLTLAGWPDRGAPSAASP